MTDGNGAADADAGLAAIVEKPRTGDAIESLREEGCYDDERRVESHDTAHVAIPVLDTPTETAVETVSTVDLPRRIRGLETVLRERGVEKSLIERAPSSWAVIGDIVLVDFGDVSTAETLKQSEREIVGNALLALHGNAETVLARGGIDGTRRDPSTTVVAGADRTETVHTEYGTEYAIDFASVMFSPGNKAERTRMGRIVDPGDRVFDMFAGIGYFTLPMARAGATVTAAEIDPESYRLLRENVRRNGVTDRVRPINSDCRTVETAANRVVAGYYDAPAYLETALDALVPGGMLHLHEATPEQLFPENLEARLRTKVEGADRSLEIRDTCVVKSHSAGVVHGVIDAQIV